MKSLELPTEVTTAIKTIGDEVNSKYAKKIEQLEKDLAEAKRTKAGNRWGSDEFSKPLQGVYLDRFVREVDPKDLGRLTTAFMEKFYDWNLLIRTNVALNSRDTVEVVAIPAKSCFDYDVERREICNDEFQAMRNFIFGFFAGIHAYRRKKCNRCR